MTRTAKENRKTKETDISVDLNIDGSGEANVSTGIGFFDHMLTALACHSGWDLSLDCKGDLKTDGHHTVEDVGIVLGQAFAGCLGDKSGIARYASFSVPMDEALATAHVDLSGRPYLVFEANFRRNIIGDLEADLIREFFYAFAVNAKITLHVRILYGENDHHKAEAMFKALAHSLRLAAMPGRAGGQILSTKGVL